MEKYEIRLSGSGGQGVILASIILADAAIEQGLNAIQTQSYGPEARGGSSKAELIISREEISYPKLRKANILLSLTQNAYDKYIASLDKDGILIVDEDIKLSGNYPVKTYRLPILKNAVEKFETAMVANIISVGAIYELIGEDVIDKEIMIRSISERVPPPTIQKNLEAFEEGINLIRGYYE
ncbi:MAG TPA: 2-oxoacid:acceptor oxidoreductase family protein [Sedimentibacter sp.]|mgnify:CR=1 FL=1|jgi:2-oxoglutarate ferredoxin oxidoreductase subunit gamma|nr:2-oxoacid:acceptor oxidoreductase family protein [Sedimentibacter sp.]HHZ00819.1 2-oxoacid:ferredoxin oxidoreductase subunit gamma [Tissierellia bacterium]HOK49624.1 2-oxoacid:acceptor oxidoreductase family protein [Sedimentibacter sp.]HOW22061.1 2-oxoacid:acceptor oxidoreductase family protein [Sedimentibacter sp.]HRC79924.1 2-oxoacid:acceptor oxidoreductase family protein [Sedimentibacter sp.]